MKSNLKTKKVFIEICLSIIILMVISQNNLNYVVIDKREIINCNANTLKSAKISEIIYINNNWSDAKEAGICSGEGTYSNPYIIENLVIDGGGSETCIQIENSSVYFKIKNCSLYNAGIYSRGGILLINVNNSVLKNNTCYVNEWGIALKFCNNNTVIGNKLYNNSNGIYLSHSNDNKISKNIVSENNFDGISLYSSYFNIISRNIANQNPWAGIEIDYCQQNNISGNIVNNNGYTGIYLAYSYNQMISNNTITKGGITIYGTFHEDYHHNIDLTNSVNGKNLYYYANRKNLDQNDFINAGQVILVNCSDSLILNLNITNCVIAISLYRCNNTSVIQNTVNDNGRGIALRYCNNCKVLRNIANDNYNDGIFLGKSEYNIIKENTVNKNRYRGIYLWIRSNFNFISRNIVNNNEGDGIYLWLSNNNTFTENIIMYNELGLFVDSSDKNKIYLNCFNNIFNALDDGLENVWDNGERGNFWADYDGLDVNYDGIGDTPYNIAGSAHTQDRFPLIVCPVPSKANKVIPGYNLFYLFSILSILLILITKKIKKS